MMTALRRDFVFLRDVRLAGCSGNWEDTEAGCASMVPPFVSERHSDYKAQSLAPER